MKIQADPTACHGCPDNPNEGEDRKRHTELLQIYGMDLAHIGRLHDAARMGMLRLTDLSESEFDQLRIFWWAIERQRPSLL